MVKPGPAKDYLNMYAVQANGCWHFTGTINQDNGYGTCRGTGAHRYFHEHFIGPIPEGMHVDHLCHVPGECAGGTTCLHRRCVNPQHLKAVTPRENVLRSNSFVALNAAATHCTYGHEYSGENLVLLEYQRTCRICQTRRARAAHRRAQARSVADSKDMSPAHLAIVEALAAQPLTDFDLADRTGLSRQFVSQSRGQLVRGGLVERAGVRHRTPSRRPASLWRLAA